MTIATKKGDQGNTRLLYGKSVPKSHVRVEAYGEVDELNAFLGICRANDSDPTRKEWLFHIQSTNFVLGAELATPEADQKKLKTVINQEQLDYLQVRVDQLEKIPGVVDGWSIPGDNVLAAWYDAARCVCRRVERKMVLLDHTEGLKNPFLLAFINRLSDLIWLMGRQVMVEKK
ncbi:MAG: ATP:cob(I)alamin adenosyltransferase [SAR324 cluster bacterium]|uniref:Corrinoid adenosyltransferase n=1 Tax=SAR324 cluster bacterium TaxID=2024889 RepID=A0A2A4SSD4_9DELT|nr:MAG: ATP:cob(I)alamin adenosyltransferase [SAR324 cluster bacterium]